MTATTLGTVARVAIIAALRPMAVCCTRASGRNATVEDEAKPTEDEVPTVTLKIVSVTYP